MAAEPEPEELHARTVSYLPSIARLLPHAAEAEKGVLCSFLLCPREIGQMCIEQGITADHFYFPAHGLIYSTLLEFWHENEPLDVISLTVDMRNKGTLAQVGGAGFLTDLCGYLPTAANAGHYLEIIREKYILREVIKIGTEAACRGYDEQHDVPKLLTETVESMMKVVRLAEGKKNHTRTMRQLMHRAMQRIDARREGEYKVEMPTGIKALDRACLGFSPATVTIILGAPSDGKSSLAMNIAEHLALECGKRVGILSLDDTDDEVATRLLQQRARVNMFEFEQTGVLTPDEEDRIKNAAIEFGQAEDRLFIRDDGALTPSQIYATFSKWQAEHGLDFGIIDHIQLARQDGISRGSTEDSNQVSRSLKPMAKQLGIPLLVLSQRTETAAGHYKTKNTSSLQEDANRIWTISRKEEEGSTDAWINIGKQKNGPTPKIPVSYFREFTRFCDRDHVAEEQPALIDFGKLANQRTKKK